MVMLLIEFGQTLFKLSVTARDGDGVHRTRREHAGSSIQTLRPQRHHRLLPGTANSQVVPVSYLALPGINGVRIAGTALSPGNLCIFTVCSCAQACEPSTSGVLCTVC